MATKNVMRSQIASTNPGKNDSGAASVRKVITVTDAQREDLRARMKDWINAPATKDVLQRLAD